METRRYKNLQLFGSPSNKIGNFVDTSFLLGLIRGLDDCDPVTKGTSVAGGTPVEISFFSVLFIDQATESQLHRDLVIKNKAFSRIIDHVVPHRVDANHARSLLTV